VGLRGKADKTVFAYAWREKRVLLTHDKDYLSDRQYPFTRNPGVIVLPGEEGEQAPLGMAIRSMLNIFGTHGRIFPNAKIVIDSNNVWYIKNHRKSDGFIEHSKLKFTKTSVYRWDD
jgi:predicted nuclease of predicted toxin-antitoxin system